MIPHIGGSIIGGSLLIFIGLAGGMLIALIGHIEKLGNYSWLTPLFLALHMIIELGHHMHHPGEHPLWTSVVHGLFDLGLLWILLGKKLQSFALWIVGIIAGVAITLPFHTLIESDLIEGIVVGGIIACVAIHLYRGK